MNKVNYLRTVTVHELEATLKPDSMFTRAETKAVIGGLEHRLPAIERDGLDIPGTTMQTGPEVRIYLGPYIPETHIQYAMVGEGPLSTVIVTKIPRGNGTPNLERTEWFDETYTRTVFDQCILGRGRMVPSDRIPNHIRNGKPHPYK
jgi:hypothetical protein